jgi:hypothetical protein
MKSFSTQGHLNDHMRKHQEGRIREPSLNSSTISDKNKNDLSEESKDSMPIHRSNPHHKRINSTMSE